MGIVPGLELSESERRARCSSTPTTLLGWVKLVNFALVIDVHNITTHQFQVAEVLVADVSFVCPTRQFTRAVQKYQPKTYLYQFTYVTRIGNFLGIGAFHGSEIEYVFGILTSLATPQEQALSDAMITYWTNFAKTGDPNSAATAVTWPTYTFQEDPHLQLDIPISAGHELHKKQCDLLGSLQGSN
ncbi:carboxylesterase family protein [Candidatus Acetothermia bacterium]|nr:carboxylesterase family protein [Candidatus Acetothermia bacterium]